MTGGVKRSDPGFIEKNELAKVTFGVAPNVTFGGSGRAEFYKTRLLNNRLWVLGVILSSQPCLR